MENNWLDRQVKNAEQALENWPEWMKVLGKFVGSETRHSAYSEKCGLRDGGNEK